MDARILRRLELLDTAKRQERLKGQKSNGADANINITPLVDVVLVLLIIFMVVTPMLDDGIELPKAVDPQKLSARGEDLKITLKRDRQIKIDDKLIAEQELNTRLSSELSKNHFRPVYVSADKSLPFSKVRELLTALRDAGVSEAGLMSTVFREEP